MCGIGVIALGLVFLDLWATDEITFLHFVASFPFINKVITEFYILTDFHIQEMLKNDTQLGVKLKDHFMELKVLS